MRTKKIKTITLLTCANVINNGTTFFILMYLSQTSSPSEFGSISISASIVMQGATLIDFGTGFSLVRMYSAEPSNDVRASIILTAKCMRMFCTIAALFLLFPAYILLSRYVFKQMDGTLIAIAISAIPVFSWWNFYRCVNQAKTDYVGYAGSVSLLATVRIVGIFLVPLAQPALTTAEAAILLMYIFAPSAVIIVNALASRRISSSDDNALPTFAMTHCVHIMKYGRWIFASSMLFPLVTNIPLWYFGVSKEMDHAGTFGLGVYFGAAIMPLREAIRYYILPYVVSLNSDFAVSQYLRAIYRSGYILFPAFLVIGFVVVTINQHLNGDRYQEANVVILIMVFTQIVTTFSSAIASVLHYLNAPQIDTYINIIRVISCTILTFLFLPAFGAVGAAVISSACILIGETIMISYVFCSVRCRLKGALEE